MRQIAARAGIDHATLSRWLHNKSKPNKTQLQKLLTAFSETDSTKTVASENSRFREALIAFRAANQLTQNQLSDLTGIGQPLISKWERGTAHFDVSKLQSILEKASSINPVYRNLAHILPNADLSTCFNSFHSYEVTCRFTSRPEADFWYNLLSMRLRQISAWDREALRALSDLHAAHCYYHISNGREQAAKTVARRAVRSVLAGGYTGDSLYALWILARMGIVSPDPETHTDLSVVLEQLRPEASKNPFFQLSEITQSRHNLSENSIYDGLKKIAQTPLEPSGPIPTMTSDYWYESAQNLPALFALGRADWPTAINACKTSPKTTLIEYIRRYYLTTAEIAAGSIQAETDFKAHAQYASQHHLDFAAESVPHHIQRLLAASVQYSNGCTTICP